MSGFTTLQHLLPNARAWGLTATKQLRQFFEGLGGVQEDVKAFDDGVYNDLDPQLTRELPAWEKQFNLPATGLSEQDRRDRLEARWKALGGQDPQYIQETLQAAGFPVTVHEWWEPVFGRPAGGSINNDVSPVARDPFQYLWDGAATRQFIGSGHDSAFCNGDSMFANSNDSPSGYPLVNKILIPGGPTLGSGHELMFAGGAVAYSGSGVSVFVFRQYEIPADPTKYPFFLYIGGEIFPELATVSLSRKDEFEDLCLKICPTEQWLGILVDYT